MDSFEELRDLLWREHKCNVGRSTKYGGHFAEMTLTDATCELIVQVPDVRVLKVSAITASAASLEKLRVLTDIREFEAHVPSDWRVLSFLSSLSRLEEVTLSGEGDPCCANAIVELLESATGMRIVRFTDLGFAAGDVAVLARLPRLQNIELHSEHVRAGFQEYEILSGLKRLDLMSSTVSSVAFREIGKLRNVCQLHLLYTAADDDVLSEISQMRQLRKLSIDHTEVTAHGSHALSNLAALEALSIDLKALNDETIHSLTGCVQLRELWVWGGECGTMLKRKLREALPRCEITYW